MKCREELVKACLLECFLLRRTDEALLCHNVRAPAGTSATSRRTSWPTSSTGWMSAALHPRKRYDPLSAWALGPGAMPRSACARHEAQSALMSLLSALGNTLSACARCKTGPPRLECVRSAWEVVHEDCSIVERCPGCLRSALALVWTWSACARSSEVDHEDIPTS